MLSLAQTENQMKYSLNHFSLKGNQFVFVEFNPLVPQNQNQSVKTGTGLVTDSSSSIFMWFKPSQSFSFIHWWQRIEPATSGWRTTSPPLSHGRSTSRRRGWKENSEEMINEATEQEVAQISEVRRVMKRMKRKKRKKKAAGPGSRVSDCRRARRCQSDGCWSLASRCFSELVWKVLEFGGLFWFTDPLFVRPNESEPAGFRVSLTLVSVVKKSCGGAETAQRNFNIIYNIRPVSDVCLITKILKQTTEKWNCVQGKQQQTKQWELFDHRIKNSDYRPD